MDFADCDSRIVERPYTRHFGIPGPSTNRIEYIRQFSQSVGSIRAGRAAGGEMSGLFRPDRVARSGAMETRAHVKVELEELDAQGYVVRAIMADFNVEPSPGQPLSAGIKDALELARSEADSTF